MTEIVSGADLDALVAALDAGGVVAVPTDTVYGLAARIDRPQGIAAIFEVKGRPEALALPVLVAEVADVGRVAARWPSAADALARAFWPGPLTLVVPARAELGPRLGGEGMTVGLRLPDHQLVRSLCAAAGPLAVTSANRHAEPPCTTASAVVSAFDGTAVALVVDGGTCDGTPSTVVDCTTEPPRCLREGGVSWDRVEAALA